MTKRLGFYLISFIFCLTACQQNQLPIGSAVANFSSTSPSTSNPKSPGQSTTTTSTTSSTSSSSSSTSTSSSSTTTTTNSTGGDNSNAVPVTIGGYINEPMVSVTVCVPNTSNCVTVNNLLLDSGSSGVRIFSSALSPSFISSLQGTGDAECQLYGGNFVQWGPVMTADISLGQEKASSLPFQLIEQSYGDDGKACMAGIVAFEQNAKIYNPNSPPYFQTPSSTYNGIVGVNFIYQDCGLGCATEADNNLYYACNGSTCSGTTVATNNQVANPIGAMPDNNGAVFDFQAPPNGLANNLQGTMYLGIGTHSNNQVPGGITTLAADEDDQDSCYLYFEAQWNGQDICAFIDSGTNAIAFPNITNGTAIPVDQYSNYAPTGSMPISVTNLGANGTSSPVSFSIVNFDLYAGTYNVIQGWGSEVPADISADFDFGLPFFLGKKIFIGLEGKDSPAGTGYYGLYWAY